MILDVVGAECCHARLSIGCVVGDGQCIGVKYSNGLALAVHLNFVFASDYHNIVLLILTRSFFVPCSVLRCCIRRADRIGQ